MHYSELNIQTLRTAPNDQRTEGQALLYRANYADRDGAPLALGERVIANFSVLLEKEKLAAGPGGDPLPGIFTRLGLPALPTHEGPGYRFEIQPGSEEILRCPGCGYNAERSLAQARKTSAPAQQPRPTEAVETPECPTIESLAQFLGIPATQTAKALMFTRPSDGQFIFVVIRGDGQLSQAKLEQITGPVRMATNEEIIAHGAVPGYASPIGVQNALLLVDELVPASSNLVAGANRAGYHLLNTNCGRDYQPSQVADLLQAQPGEACPVCGEKLGLSQSVRLFNGSQLQPGNLLLALAQTFRDPSGLTLPPGLAPFDVYLMHVPGKTIDTLAAATEIYQRLATAGQRILFDDRDERAGVKFNDADLLGCPIRITVGERALQNGCVEVKRRTEKESTQVTVQALLEYIQS